MDARKFNDLRLSSNFLPVVALNDPAAGNLTPGISSSGGSPQRGCGGGESPKGRGKGKSKTTYRFNKPLPKQADPKGRAKDLPSLWTTCTLCSSVPLYKSSSTSSQHGTNLLQRVPTSLSWMFGFVEWFWAFFRTLTPISFRLRPLSSTSAAALP